MTRLLTLLASLMLAGHSSTSAFAGERELIEFALTKNGVPYFQGVADVTVDPYFPPEPLVFEQAVMISASSTVCAGKPPIAQEIVTGRSVIVARVLDSGRGVALTVWARDTRQGDLVKAEMNGCVTEGPRVLGPVLPPAKVHLTSGGSVDLPMSDPRYALRLHLRGNGL